MRLSHGFKQLKEAAEKGASPLDLLTQAYSIPGMTPQMAESLQGPLREAGLMSLGKNQAATTGGINRAAPSSEISPTLTGQSKTSMGPEAAPSVQNIEQTEQNVPGRLSRTAATPAYLSQFDIDTNTLTTPEAIKTALTTDITPSPEQRDARAIEVQANNPLLFPTRDKALARVDEEISAANNRRTAQLNLRSRELQLEKDYNTGFDNRVAKLTGDSGVVPSEYVEKIKREGLLDTRKGKTPEEASNAASKRILSLDKAITSMRNNIGGRAVLGKNSEQLNRDIKNARDVFANNDALELFKDEQKTYLDQGDHLASHTAWPPTSELKKGLHDVSINDSPAQIAAKLSDKIKDADSIFSMGYLLNRLGVDDEAVVQQLSKILQDGNINLNDRQRKEISEYYPTTITLGDALWTGLTQTTPLKYFVEKPKISGKEKLKRALGGKV